MKSVLRTKDYADTSGGQFWAHGSWWLLDKARFVDDAIGHCFVCNGDGIEGFAWFIPLDPNLKVATVRARSGTLYRQPETVRGRLGSRRTQKVWRRRVLQEREVFGFHEWCCFEPKPVYVRARGFVHGPFPSAVEGAAACRRITERNGIRAYVVPATAEETGDER